MVPLAKPANETQSKENHPDQKFLYSGHHSLHANRKVAITWPY